MTHEGSRQVILHLMMHFPRSYPPDMPQQRVEVLSSGILEAFKSYDDDIVLQAYRDLLSEKSAAPYIAEAVAKVRLIAADRARNMGGHYDGEIAYFSGVKHFWNTIPGSNPIGWVKVAPMPRYMQERLIVLRSLPPGAKDPHNGEWYKARYGKLPPLKYGPDGFTEAKS